MKKILVLFVFVFAGEVAHAQPDPRLFNATKLVWCGLDYSNVRCLGPKKDFKEPNEIKDKYFQAWNDLVLGNSDRYDFGKTYKKTQLITDLSVVNRRNKILEVEKIWGDEAYEIPAKHLKYMIAGYNLEKAQEGVGLVFVVEALNKIKENAVIHVIFFDIATKSILWADKYTQGAGGAGFLNYWVQPIYETMKTSGKIYKKALRSFQKGS